VLAVVVPAALQTPVYRSTADVLIAPRGSDGVFRDDVEQLDERALQTEMRVIEGPAVRQRVATDLQIDGPVPDVSAEGVGQSAVVEVSVRSTSASNARTLADAYASAYIDIRRERSVDGLTSAGAEVERALGDLRAQIDGLTADDPSRSSLVARAVDLGTTLDQLSVDAALQSGAATVISAATVPSDPIEPSPVRDAAWALLVGLLVGLAAAWTVDALDRTVRRPGDLVRLADLPVLAVVAADPPPNNLPVSVSHPEHPAVEEYRRLRVNLEALARDRKLSVIQVTSSLPGEGSTTTAANLAVLLARAGHRVALVDADFRRPHVHEMFARSVAPGLADLLLGASPRDAVQVTDLLLDDRLALYTAGELPSNPGEMLGGVRMRKVLEKMGEHYDWVIVDSAPILPVTDSVALSSAVDGVIMVVRAGRSTTTDLGDALERLETVRAPILGFVLNHADSRRRRVDGYDVVSGQRNPGNVAVDSAHDPSVGDDLFTDV
jgi:capsular exopolysaccharide synthesis family protein